jgi:hypothetical protein
LSKRLRITVGVLACLTLGSGVSALGATALAHEVPNEANWHIHDGTGPGPSAGSHHAGLAFFPALFAQEGLVYGTAEAPYVRCPNATDKGLLPHGAQGAVTAAGVCMSDKFVLHLRSGTDAPEGWSTLAGTTLHYRLTPVG